MTEPPSDPIQIGPELRIPRAELGFRATRSGGPGGQHVNTSSTRVEITWNVAESPSLSEEQRARLRERLSSRIDSSGTLRITESGSRSQLRNREAAVERLVQVVRAGLHVPKRRTRTRPPKSAKEARLRSKKRRSAVKRLRGPVDGAE